MTLKSIKASNWKDCFEGMKSIIAYEYSNHLYLKESNKLTELKKKSYNKILKGEGDESDYTSSLWDLSKYLRKHHGRKVLILIDEFDTP